MQRCCGCYVTPRLPTGLLDDERPLTELGVRAGAGRRRALERLGATLDACLSSPKLRAVQTAEHACAPIGVEVTVEPRLSGEPFDVADLTAGFEDTMLVGHDPSFTLKLHELTGAQARMSKGGLAAINKGELIMLMRPHELFALAASERAA